MDGCLRGRHNSRARFSAGANVRPPGRRAGSVPPLGFPMNAPENLKARTKATFNWSDPLLLDDQLREEERMVRDAAHAYAQDKLMPRVTEAFRHERSDPEIFREMGSLGLLGSTLPADYGGAGAGVRGFGLSARLSG